MASGEAGAGHPGGARRSHSSPASTVARDASGSRATSTSYYGRRSPDLAPGFGDCWPILAVVGDAEIATRAPAASGDQAAFDVFEKDYARQEAARTDYDPTQWGR